ncbi:uncharacterized protein TM35_000331970 [Trypanosoma theileri]|uniref:Uncharacterized protein n=1 Tax=Trypanosoma theileri TaxID=67003 RepID=A0A1X0NNM1_9TRYP|nr:uncharacterized protein TM35_000331970 [Trypanosoma theileri]ORC85740.1 hypothetical protein TM35_000331970 [Trypanosoma theileri]
MTQVRTFVFITNIPDFLLEPMEVSSNISSRARANRDPRYERLRSLLAANTSGVMIVMHLETRGYALALYASEQEALAACKTTITPQNGNPPQQYPPLQLRILQRERPAPCEAVYTPTITIEGTTVQKSDLVPTRGLELVYRGRAVARWCPHTQAHEDCLFGTSCHRIHLKAYQHTVRKRPRMDVITGTGGTANNTTATTTSAIGAIEAEMTREEMEVVRNVTRSTRLTEELLVPAEMQLDFSVYVSITHEEALSLVGNTGSTACSNTIAATATAVRANIVKRVKESCSTYKGPYFIRFAFPGGAPWDWSLHDESEGLPQLRQRAPFPENGAPTPLERDLFCQKLLYHVNQMNKFTTIDAALRAFETSPRVCEALHQYLQQENDQKDKKEKNSNEDSSGTSTMIELCIRPWLFLPTADMETVVLLEKGGEYIRGVAQRHAALRLMTSATFLQQHQLDFTRYAVIGNNEDPEAEDALEMELRRVGTVVKRGVDTLRRHVRQQCTREKIPSSSAWCIQLAVVIPDGLGMEENNNSGNSNVNGPVSTTTVSGENSTDVGTMHTVVLSLKPYQTALEEFTAIYGTRQDVSSAGNDDNDRVRKEVLWNTKKHPYISLFSRELMERLKRDGNE